MKMKKAVKMPLRRPPQRPRPSGSPLRARAATVEETYDEEEEEDYGSEAEPNMKFTHALFVVLVLHLIAVGGVFAFNWMKTKQGGDSAQTAKAAAEKSVTPETGTAGADPAAKAETAAAKPAPSKPANLDGWEGRTHTVQAGDTLTLIASTHKTTVQAIEKENEITSYSLLRVGQVLKIPGGEKTAKTASASSKSGANAAKDDAPAKPASAGVIAAVPRSAATAPATAEKAEKTEKATPKPAELKTTAAAPGDVYVVAKGDNPYTIAKKLHVSYNQLLEVNGIKDATKIQIGQKLKIPSKN